MTLGYYVPAFVYSALQILSEAVSKTGGVDQQELISYIHGNTFQTVVGNITFGPDGEWVERLLPGERAVVLCLATDRDQAKIIFGDTESQFRDIPLLFGLVQRETASGLEQDNRVDVTIATNSFRSLRGRPVLDECAFYRDDSSAAPDEEMYATIKLGTATLPNSIIIGISSPYRKLGLLYKQYEKHSAETASWSSRHRPLVSIRRSTLRLSHPR
ncbi:hypothetical protein [Bradyrhizobium japonicum]|uniref:hypothetical protein n=1 Tax=Bradyrhizobium japonicum TaxID=375 RepID=UPI00117DE2D5|nr:hypothetical protein [Bradyrhizobium japonicum]